MRWRADRRDVTPESFVGAHVKKRLLARPMPDRPDFGLLARCLQRISWRSLAIMCRSGRCRIESPAPPRAAGHSSWIALAAAHGQA